ncbi:MAG: HAMP domain-containing protein, partial [Chromatiaceae bacterium]|nr:HAMP domain-containing protein [Chromatiaceae bacterium]
GAKPDVLAVTIANPQGEVRFANDPARLGQRLPPESDDQPATRLIVAQTGPTVLRSVNPVPNQPPCQECHGPMAEHPVNGVLYVDYDADSIGQQARHTTLLLMGAGSLIVLLNLGGGWWFMRRYVLLPVAQLAEASVRISEGDLSTRTHLTGGDELTVLGETMNRMASALGRQMAELQEKEHFLQALVDAFPDGIRVIDQDYRVVLCNAAYRRQIGSTNPAIPMDPAQASRPCYAQTHGQGPTLSRDADDLPAARGNPHRGPAAAGSLSDSGRWDRVGCGDLRRPPDPDPRRRDPPPGGGVDPRPGPGGELLPRATPLGAGASGGRGGP